MSKKKGKGPVLYIHQPFSIAPSDFHMQEVYISRQEVDQVQEEHVEDNYERPQPGAVQGESPGGGRKISGFTRVKPFKEMNIGERLDYLINYPKVLPAVPCVFYTEAEKFLGTLDVASDREITIQTANQLTVTIPINELKNIIMLGIRK